MRYLNKEELVDCIKKAQSYDRDNNDVVAFLKSKETKLSISHKIRILAMLKKSNFNEL